VVAVKVREKNDLDVDGLDGELAHVREERCAAVEQDLAVNDYGTVVTLGGEGRPRAEECKFQATVTALFR
jgi:hypothetical protein